MELEFEFDSQVDAAPDSRSNFSADSTRVCWTALDSGPLIGYPVDRHCRLAWLDGSYHEEDSTEMAFGVAATMAIRKAHR